MGIPAGATIHPWNDGSDFALPPRPAASVLTDDQRAQFERDGYTVVENIFAGDELAQLTAELDDLEAQTERWLAKQDNGRVNIAEAGAITFTTWCVLRSEAARRATQHPTMLALCNDLLGPDVNLYWDQAVYKKPEKPRPFPWHQDTGYTFTRPQNYLTIWVSLNGATVDNGCPWVLPGAHVNGTLLHRWVDPIGWQCIDDPEGAVPAEVPAGGAVVFSSLTPHQTGPNVTDAPRKAYIVQYGPAGMTRVTGEWWSGAAPTGAESCDEPDRQYAVLRNGQPV
ncbi:MAG TPA: phytanoyl-CoA dioxygenase family protein [Acidimicrobiales bacterium]|nr:phytanoyl-CoA dioxygenase family protein [Acidimicrobiales bacterium]